MDAGSIAQQIFSLAKAIYDQAQLVKANREQCVLLAERVQTIQSAIKKLGKIPDSEAYRQSLGRLKTCLQEAYIYMQTLSKEKWQWEFIRAKSHKSTFEAFNNRLAEAIGQLNLGLNAQTILNREEDQKAARADRETLLKKQDEILQLNYQILDEVKCLPNQSFHERQMTALQSQLQILLAEVKNIKKSPASTSGLDEKFAIPYYELQLVKEVGVGSFGTVYLGKWQDRPVAIKEWNGKLKLTEQQQFIREVQILQHLNTPRFVPQFYGASLEGGLACLVMEYCELGSLFDYLPKQKLTLAEQYHLAFSLVQALSYLHGKKIVHRDLKSANILLVMNGKYLEAKITDFGLSKAQYPSIVSAEGVSQALAWCAPETLKGEAATYAADVFSVGMILWEIFTARRPFSERTALKDWILSGKRESCIGIPKAVAELIGRCWLDDPRMRPPALELVEALRTLSEPTPVTVIAPKPIKPSVILDTSLTTSDMTTALSPVAAFSSAVLSVSITSTLEQKKQRTPGEVAYDEARSYHAQKDYVHARQYYEQALTAGVEQASNKLATLLIRGQGGVADEKRAIQLFERAAARGDMTAMGNLAQVYRFGTGVSKDPEKAAAWQAKHDQAVKPASPAGRGSGSPAMFHDGPSRGQAGQSPPSKTGDKTGAFNPSQS
jgi:serine/threonine protein kinase